MHRPLLKTLAALTAFFTLVLPAWTAGLGNRSELKISGARRHLGQRELADHFATLRFRIEDHARSRLEGDAQTSAGGASYVSIIPYVAADSNTRTNVGLNNFSQNSLTHGQNPSTGVLIGLFDPQGNVAGSGEFTVRANELVQLDNIISRLGSNIAAGWLLIYSDEPLTAWASVIRNDNNDPAIELAIADQIYKPSAFAESTGTRLIIQSSVKSGTFQSSLAVVNVGAGDGNLTMKIYDNTGILRATKTASLRADGMYADSDIRSGADGFGQIVIEVTDANAGDNKSPRLVANSFIRSANGTSGFFPAFALPQANTISIAGRWEGTLSGSTLINAQVRIDLYQERDMLYGTFDILSGVFPTLDRSFLIAGEVIENNYVLQIQDIIDGDVNRSLLSYRFLGALSGTRLQGDAIYFDELNRSAVGTFNLGRTGSIY
ncbi:MAG: hypothetical protein L0338_07120 [Acidobacteria bacterium]|nr:hypothetical protein [Acidobacteriota bacterium]